MKIDRQVQILEESRVRLHRLIDERYDLLREGIENGVPIGNSQTVQRLSLKNDLSVFKGTKPFSVTLPDGQTVHVNTWRKVASLLLEDCNRHEERHNRLHRLCNKAAGRLRPILSNNPNEMDVPLPIDEGLYFEGKFDTEFLLKMLTERVLKPVGYPCDDIAITVRCKPSYDVFTIESAGIEPDPHSDTLTM